MTSDPTLDLSEFAKARLTKSEPLGIGGHALSAERVVELVGPLLTEARLKRLDQVVAGRSYKIAPVLENPYDMGNVSAVMRSSEAFGFVPFHIISPPGSRFKAANRVTKGAEKWLDVHIHREVGACVDELKAQGFQVYATHLEASEPITAVDFTKPTAIVFGNEKEGVSAEMLERVDGRFIIPISGFTQSFNISVAAAISLYHAWLERSRKLGRSGDLTAKEQEILLANYYLRCLDNPEAIIEKLLAKSP